MVSAIIIIIIIIIITIIIIISGALVREARASGVPWVSKFAAPSARTPFGGDGRKSGASPPGVGVCYKSCDVFFLRFSRREIAQEMAWPSRHVQKLVYFVFKYFNHNDRSTHFLANSLRFWAWK